MRKLRPDSNQSDLGAEACDRLEEACRTMSYVDAVAWARAELGIATSPASLCRWYQRRQAELTRGRLRRAVKASEDFDAALDARDLDRRAAMALRAAYWEAVQSGDLESITRLGKLVLDYNASDRGAEEFALKQRAQVTKDEQLRLAREKFEASEARLNAARETLKRLDASGGLSAEARAEIEKAMGVL